MERKTWQHFARESMGTGPKTKEDKDRIRAAHLKHGEEILEAKAKRSAKKCNV